MSNFFKFFFPLLFLLIRADEGSNKSKRTMLSETFAHIRNLSQDVTVAKLVVSVAILDVTVAIIKGK